MILIRLLFASPVFLFVNFKTRFDASKVQYVGYNNTVKINLIRWLVNELEIRGWSQRELARRAGISQTTVSQVIAYQRQPTWDFCAKIARVLDEPLERVFRMAGLLPSLPADKEMERELLGHFRHLDGSGKKEAIAVVKALRETREGCDS